MKLSSVLGKVRGGTTVVIFDYLTEECYGNDEAQNILESNVYHQEYKNCEVYGIDVRNNELEVRILKE